MVDLELEYTPSSRVEGGSDRFVADWRRRSEAASADLAADTVELPGGSLLVARDGSAPLLVFIHGGYWQALSARESLYLAPGASALGWSYAAVEYTIAPGGTIEQMVAKVREALGALGAVVTPSHVVLAGHSAGGHLAAMSTLVATAPIAIDRLVLLSGVFDLRPIVHTNVNDPLDLDEGRAATLSPRLLPVSGRVGEVVVAWGDNETDAFKDQSRAYAATLRSAGIDVATVECRSRHHFDIVDDLVDPRSELGVRTVGVE